MTEWKIVEKGEAEKPSLVEPVRTYVMHPGDVQFYDIAWCIRRSGKRRSSSCASRAANLDLVRRSNIKAK